MKRALRMAFYGVSMLVWLFCVWAGLELYHRFAWGRIEKHNPFVRARIDALPWPETVPVPFPEGIVHVDSESAPRRSALSLPEADPVEERARRAAFFLSLSEADRTSFAQAYLQTVLLVDGSGRIRHAYSAAHGTEKTLHECEDWIAGGALAKSLDSALATQSPVLIDPPGGGPPTLAMRAFVFPQVPTDDEGTRACVFFDLREPRDEVPEESVFELPFFVNRKHGKLAIQPFQTNNYGFRDDDVVVPRPDDVFRIVCVGGSTTEEGDNNADTYPNRLERKLNAFYRTDRIDVVNCGISGLNSSREKMRLPDYLALEPNLIIYYNGINDICHHMFDDWVKQAGPWQSFLRDSQFINYHFNRFLLPARRQTVADLDRITFSNLRFMHDRVSEAGVAMVFCTFARPDFEHLSDIDRDYYDYYNNLEWGGKYVTFATYCRVLDVFNEQIKALCGERGVPCFPVAEHITGGTYYFGDLCHMKNEGIDLKADIMLTYIDRHFAEPIRARIGAQENPPVSEPRRTP